MKGVHQYKVIVHWTGNRGRGTTGYADYDRSHIISVENKPDLLGSSDVAFRGDATKYNPEDLLLASISTCHMLWYLHLCADAGIVVVSYADHASGTMVESPQGGRFTEVTLYPEVTITDSDLIQQAIDLHILANEKCFISNSLNFPVKHEPKCTAN